MTTLATTPNMSFGIIPEVTWGTTPSSALTTLRVTADAMETVTSTIKALEIVGTREVQDVMRTEVYGKGSVNFFLSYGNLDTLLAGLFQNTWVTGPPDTLVPGSTFTSFTLEKHFADVGLFHTFPGAVVDGLTLDLKNGAAVAGSMSFISKAGLVGTATAGSGAYAAAETNPVMQTVDYIQLINEGGSPVADITQFTLAVKNNLRPQIAMASANLVGVGTGMFEVDGTLVGFFTSDALITKYLAGTSSSLEVKVGGSSSLFYDILLSKVRYTKCAILGKSPNSDIMVEIAFSGYYDATNSTFKLSRHN